MTENGTVILYNDNLKFILNEYLGITESVIIIKFNSVRDTTSDESWGVPGGAYFSVVSGIDVEYTDMIKNNEIKKTVSFLLKEVNILIKNHLDINGNIDYKIKDGQIDFVKITNVTKREKQRKAQKDAFSKFNFEKYNFDK